jgi:hypothetical protein
MDMEMNERRHGWSFSMASCVSPGNGRWAKPITNAIEGERQPMGPLSALHDRSLFGIEQGQLLSCRLTGCVEVFRVKDHGAETNSSLETSGEKMRELRVQVGLPMGRWINGLLFTDFHMIAMPDGEGEVPADALLPTKGSTDLLQESI